MKNTNLIVYAHNKYEAQCNNETDAQCSTINLKAQQVGPTVTWPQHMQSGKSQIDSVS